MSATDIQIQTNLASFYNFQHPQLVRDAAGNLYAIYTKTAGQLCVAYSQDAGLTWNEIIASHTAAFPMGAIDSTNVLHLTWTEGAATACKYQQFTISGGFGSVEVVASATFQADDYLVIAVDSADNVHVAFTNFSDQIIYNKRTSGIWGTPTALTSAGGPNDGIQMAIDSNNYIYIVMLSNNASIRYVKFTNFWTSPVQIGSTGVTSVSDPSLTVDSLDNVHVVWGRGNVLEYVKYTKATDTWGTEAIVTTVAFVSLPTVCVDANDNLNVVFYDGNGSNDIYYITYTGSWGAESQIIIHASGHTLTNPQIQSTVYPIVGGKHINITTSGYQFTYEDTIAGVHNLRYYSSPANFPAPQTQNYSRQANASLPSTDSNLSHLFTTTEYTNVATENSIYVDQTATNQYALFEFKNQNTVNTQPISVVWIGKTSVAPSASTVSLQIYNQSSATWETLASNSAASANTNFTISGTQNTNLSNYYASGNWVSCRVYQLAV